MCISAPHHLPPHLALIPNPGHTCSPSANSPQPETQPNTNHIFRMYLPCALSRTHTQARVRRSPRAGGQICIRTRGFALSMSINQLTWSRTVRRMCGRFVVSMMASNIARNIAAVHQVRMYIYSLCGQPLCVHSLGRHTECVGNCDFVRPNDNGRLRNTWAANAPATKKQIYGLR